MQRVRVIDPQATPPRDLLDPLRAAFARGESSVRWIVPTSTLARHLRSELAREGLLVRPSAITTLFSLTDQLASPGPRAADAAQLRLIIRSTLRRFAPARWKRIAAKPGLEQTLATLAGEMDSAGYSAADLSSTVDLMRRSWPDAELFVDFYAQLESAVAAKGLSLRSSRLHTATARLFRHGWPGVQQVFVDGFFRFTEPEIALLDALRLHVDLEIILPAWPGADPTRANLIQRGFVEEPTDWPLAQATRTIIAAGSFESEVWEVARRILTLHREHGRPFGEIGVIVRSERPYVPALRSAFARFGIPARFFFAEPGAANATFRHADTLVEAAISGWDHQRLLDLLRFPDPALPTELALDSLVQRLRADLPAAGFPPQLDPIPPAWLALDALRSLELAPIDWSTRLAELLPDIASLLEQAASIADAEPLPLSAFWEECRILASETELRDPHPPSNAVAVLDAYEARQWRLPVMFVCGLLEGDFPRHPAEDPLFPDSLRRSLRDFGLTLPTLDDQQVEEKFLLDLAQSRATSHTYLTYPRANRQGEATLPAFALAAIDPASRVEATALTRPRPVRTGVNESPHPLPVEQAAARHAYFSPTGIESFLQCPFQFFGRRTLNLKPPPARPELRLDVLLEGRIIHDALARWQSLPHLSAEEAFTPIFEEQCRRARVQPGWRREHSRATMLRHLRDFQTYFTPRPGGSPRFEEKIEFDLADGLRIRGRIDRIDRFPDGAAEIYDFKYTTASGISNRTKDDAPLVQGGLYLIAVESEPATRATGFHYVALRDQSGQKGWTEPVALDELKERARLLTLEAVESIRSGDIRVDPRNRAVCEYCELRDACRIRARQGGSASA